jgi:cell division transport system permease protein
MNPYVRHILQTWQNQTATQFSALTVLTGSYTLVVFVLLLQGNLESVLTRWGSQVKLHVYMEDEADENEVADVVRFLADEKKLDDVKVISKSDALKEFKNRMGSWLPDLVRDPKFENPLPLSVQAVVPAGGEVETLANLPKIARSLAGLRNVQDVSYGQGWIENYRSVLDVFRTSTAFIVMIVLAGALMVIGSAIKSVISVKRDEIEVMELLGATPSMIRAPFLVEGAFVGCVASVFAVLITYVVFQWQSQLLVENLGFWGLEGFLSFLSLPKVVLILVGGGAIGAIGSYLSVKQLSTGWAAASRGIDHL